LLEKWFLFSREIGGRGTREGKLKFGKLMKDIKFDPFY
jgi:hypothetical protein